MAVEADLYAVPMDYEKIRRYVLETQGVTVVEVTKMLEEQGVATEGNIAVSYPYEPVLIWAGVSQEVYDVLTRLVKDTEVEVHPTTPLVYYIDGQVPTLPLANVDSVNKRYPYKKDRWLPVVFNRRRMR